MKKTLLVIAGILVPLLLVEIILRLIGFGMVKPELRFDVNTRTGLETGRLVLDRDLFWREVPGPPSAADAAMNLVRVDDPIPPRTGKFRIICLGDSCTRITLNGQPYSFWLQEGLGSGTVEVFNASLPGYTSHQGLAWLRKQLLAYEPDLVVVYFGWNDHWRSTGLTDREYAAKLAVGHLRLLDLFQRRPEQPPLRVPLRDFADNLQQIAESVERRGGRVVFVTPPSFLTRDSGVRLIRAGYLLETENANNLHRPYRQAVKVMGDDDPARIVDLATLFDYLSEHELLLYRDGIHPTDLGHAVIAGVLIDHIGYHFFSDATPPTNPAALALVLIGQQLAGEGHWGESLARYSRSMELAPQSRGPRLGLAWLLATCPVDSLRNSEAALATLEPLDAGCSNDAQCLDVKAACLAAAGRYLEAAEVANEALSLMAALGDTASPFVAEIKARLAQYEARQPYRLPPPPPSRE